MKVKRIGIILLLSIIFGLFCMYSMGKVYADETENPYWIKASYTIDETKYILNNFVAKYEVTLSQGDEPFNGTVPVVITNAEGNIEDGNVSFNNGIGNIPVYGAHGNILLKLPETQLNYKIDLKNESEDVWNTKINVTNVSGSTEGKTGNTFNETTFNAEIKSFDYTLKMNISGYTDDLEIPFDFSIFGDKVIPREIKYEKYKGTQKIDEGEYSVNADNYTFTTISTSLKNGEYIILKDLPETYLGWSSSLRFIEFEERYGFNLGNGHQGFGTSGTLLGTTIEDDKYGLNFSVYPEDKRATIMKIYTGRGIDNNKEFTFKIKGYVPSRVEDGKKTPIVGEYPFYTYHTSSGEKIIDNEGTIKFDEEGIGTFNLKVFQFIEIGKNSVWADSEGNEKPADYNQTNLNVKYPYKEFEGYCFPDGAEFEFEEVDEDCNCRTVVYINSREPSYVMLNVRLLNERKFNGQLTIKKTVSGEGADLDKEFTFKIKLEDGATDIPKMYSYTGSKEGSLEFDDNWEAEITLKDGEKITLNRLPVGAKYTITEESYKAEGYASVAENSEGKVSEEETVVEFVNEKKVVEINKVDSTGEKTLAGVKLQLKKNGEVIEEWTTTDEPHRIETPLVVGEKYVISEVETLDGYIKAEDLEFEVENKKGVQTVNFVNDYTKVRVSKVDKDGNFVSGAKLVIKDEEGNVAQEWTSSEEVYEINAKLIAGKKYTIEELEAPEGYEKAEKTEFTVSEDGTEDVIKVVDNKIIVEEKEEEKQEEPKSIRTGDMIAVAFGVISISAISLVAMILFKKRIK